MIVLASLDIFRVIAYVGQMSLTPAQCRAARAWLNWSQPDLAAAAKVSVPTIARFERGATTMSHLGLQAIEAAFARASVEISSNDSGYGGVSGRL